MLVAVTVAAALFVRWFIKTANKGKGYTREPLPRSVDDYRRGARPVPRFH